MRIYPLRPTVVLVLACLLAVLLFFAGIAAPGLYLWALFLIPLLAVFLWGRPQDIYIVGALSALLVAGGCWYTGILTPVDLLLNCGLPILVLGAAPWLLARGRQGAQIVHRAQELEKGFKGRTAELEASEEKLAEIFRANPGGIAILRQADGHIFELNDAFLGMVGLTRDQLVGRNPDDLGVITPTMSASIRDAVQGQGFVHGQDVQIRNAAGDTVDLLLSVEQLDIGGVPCYIVLVLDISERKQLETALKESEEKFVRAFTANPAGIAISRVADGCFLDANPAYLQMLGYTRDALVGRRSIDLGILSPAARAEVVARAAQQANPTPFEVQVRTKSGSTMEIMTAFSIIDVDGEPCLLTMAVDITERKQYEHLLQETNAVLEQRVAERTADLQRAVDDLQRANGLRDEFMALISHELRTPLTGVLSLAETLGDQIVGPLNQRQLVYVQGITASGNRLLYVINGILSYTHLISGKVPLQPDPCDLASLLNICAVSQQHKAAAKGLAVSVCVDPVDLTIVSDASALAGILKRLLDNAVKFTPEGGQIGLAARIGAVPATVDLIVWDTGIGFPEGQIEHILKPFAQADGTLARQYDGIGMGLAYVYEMVHHLGGTLAVASTPGGGSRFTITLPA